MSVPMASQDPLENPESVLTRVKTLADYEDQISAWHDDTTGVTVTLHEYLGLSWEQYRALVEVSQEEGPS